MPAPLAQRVPRASQSVHRPQAGMASLIRSIRLRRCVIRWGICANREIGLGISGSLRRLTMSFRPSKRVANKPSLFARRDAELRGNHHWLDCGPTADIRTTSWRRPTPPFPRGTLHWAADFIPQRGW